MLGHVNAGRKVEEGVEGLLTVANPSAVTLPDVEPPADRIVRLAVLDKPLGEIKGPHFELGISLREPERRLAVHARHLEILRGSREPNVPVQLVTHLHETRPIAFSLPVLEAGGLPAADLAELHVVAGVVPRPPVLKAITALLQPHMQAPPTGSQECGDRLGNPRLQPRSKLHPPHGSAHGHPAAPLSAFRLSNSSRKVSSSRMRSAHPKACAKARRRSASAGESVASRRSMAATNSSAVTASSHHSLKGTNEAIGRPITGRRRRRYSKNLSGKLACITVCWAAGSNATSKRPITAGATLRGARAPNNAFGGALYSR